LILVSTLEIWTYRNQTFSQKNLSGMTVEATDGRIGKVDEASNDVGASYIVVDTGPWIFGKKVLLPAGVIRNVDFDTETVFVDRTKDQIKNAPEYDEERNRGDESYRTEYRNQLGSYYGMGGLGYRDEPKP
jgi:PRC-barrel domain